MLTYERKSFLPVDYEVRYLNLSDSKTPVWGLEYVFTTEYGQTGVTPAAFLALNDAVFENPAVRNVYAQNFDAGNLSRQAITEENWRAYYCSVVNWSPKSFVDCVHAP